MNLLKAIEILQLPPNYTHYDIKKNYKILAMKYHPDKCNNDAECSEKFIKVQEAYKFVNNNQHSLFKTINELFKNIVVDVPKQFNKKNLKLEKIKLNIKDYFTGVDNIVKIKTPCNCKSALCTNCVGTGYNLNNLSVCMECLGDGYNQICNCFEEINVKLPKQFNIKQSKFEIVFEDMDNYYFENDKIYYNFKISLKDSLIGFKKTFKDPFDFEHLISVNEIIRHGDGYSIKINDCELILVFNVIYPKKILSKLKKILNDFDF